MRRVFPREPLHPLGNIYRLDAVTFEVFVRDGYIVDAWDDSQPFPSATPRWRAEVAE